MAQDRGQEGFPVEPVHGCGRVRDHAGRAGDGAQEGDLPGSFAAAAPPQEVAILPDVELARRDRIVGVALIALVRPGLRYPCACRRDRATALAAVFAELPAPAIEGLAAALTPVRRSGRHANTSTAIHAEYSVRTNSAYPVRTRTSALFPASERKACRRPPESPPISNLLGRPAARRICPDYTAVTSDRQPGERGACRLGRLLPVAITDPGTVWIVAECPLGLLCLTVRGTVWTCAEPSSAMRVPGEGACLS